MANSKRVLLIAPSAYPLGGVAVWLDYLAAGLSAHGWTPVVGLTAGRWHDVERYRLAYPHLPVLAIENPTGSAEGRIRALAQAIENVKPDVVVAVNIADLYAAAKRLSAVRPHIVMSLHGIAADLLADIKREAGALDAVIATNRLACRLCVEEGGMSEGCVFYAPYGVDVANLAALPRPPGEDALRIVWVGRLEQEQKRVDMIAPVLEHLDRLSIAYRLCIAGDGPAREPLLRELQPRMQDGRVEYLGALGAAEIGPRVYAHADVLLLTSVWETGPIVAWEAMAAGVAVVSSRYVGSGLEGALKHEENCLLFPLGDACEAALQLARLRDAAFCAVLVQGGRRLAAERYGIDHSVNAWAKCLDAVLQLPPRRLGREASFPAPAGRLDRLLGVNFGETVRSAIGLRFDHAEAGGEWPHTAATESDEAALLERAKKLDFIP